MSKIILKTTKHENRQRVGRGISAGQGKTAGRGTKGEKSRSGFNIPKRYEGGQTPLSMRLPHLRGGLGTVKKCRILSLSQINSIFDSNEEVSYQNLIAKNVLKKGDKVKILSTGKLTKKLILVDVPTSKNAQKMFAQKSIEKIKNAK